MSERITGIARLLRGYALTGLENVALWHERDISHSSVERVSLPDATILLDYAQHLAIRVVDGMTIHPERMRENLAATTAPSTRSVRCWRSWKRDAPATRPTESCRRPRSAWDEGIEFRELLTESAPELDLDTVFDPSAFVRHSRMLVQRLDRIT